MSAPLGAVVLAAGSASRMGRSKAALVHEGKSFLACAVDLAVHSGGSPIVVVQGAHDLAHLLEPDRARLVTHPAWSSGPLSSLQVGLAAVLEERPGLAHEGGVMVLTVDRPRVTPETVRALAAAFARTPSSVCQPRRGGRSGHPIIWPAALVHALLALPRGTPNGPRAVLARPEVQRTLVDVEDDAVLENLDHPGDL